MCNMARIKRRRFCVRRRLCDEEEGGRATGDGVSESYGRNYYYECTAMVVASAAVVYTCVTRVKYHGALGGRTLKTRVHG